MKSSKVKSLMHSLEYKSMFFSEEKMWWYVGTRDIIYDVVKRVKKRDKKILDAGCGTGKTLEYLTGKGLKVWGIDASKEALSYCKKRGLKNTSFANITNIPKKNNSYDIVLSIDVFNALSENSRILAIKQFKRILKTGGILIFQCAALESLRSSHDVIVNNNKRFTKKEVDDYFKPKDWKIIKSTYRIFFLFFLVYIVKTVKRILFRKEKSLISDQYMPPLIINFILTSVQILENKLARFVNFPIGSSVFVVAQKI